MHGSFKVAFAFGLGVVAAEIVKEALPAFRGLGRPLLKATVKSGLLLGRNTQVKLAEFRETLSDVAAEAQAELATETENTITDQQFTEKAKHVTGVM